MPTAVPPLLHPPVLFAAGGAARHAQPDTPDAVALAFRLGATGIWAEAHSDGEGSWMGRRRGRFARRTTRLGIEDLVGLVAERGAHLAVVVDDPAVAAELLTLARRVALVDRLWLVAEDTALLVAVRGESEAVRLLHACVPTALDGGAERHAHLLREAGIDGAAVPESAVSAGMVALLHRFTRLVVATGADHPRTATRGLAAGVDGVAGVDVEALVDASGTA